MDNERGSQGTDLEEAVPLLPGVGTDGEGGVHIYSPDQKPSAELFLLGE